MAGVIGGGLPLPVGVTTLLVVLGIVLIGKGLGAIGG